LVDSFSKNSTDVWSTGAALPRPPIADWPTLAVAACVYTTFFLLTWYYRELPWWLVLPLGSYIVCLHGSLQHEAVHGYPFRARWLNAALVFPSLWLWLPYGYYRETHLVHHRDERLTSPLDDPESNYVTAEQWARMGWAHRRVRHILMTVAGRLLIGPAYATGTVVGAFARALRHGDTQHLRHSCLHIPAVAAVVVWVVCVCGIPFWAYVLLFAYPGLALTLLRSYLEHRAAPGVDQRTAIVEAGPVMSLLYLNNNLHLLHHMDPAAPWHARPRDYRVKREALLAANECYVIKGGYREIVTRYLFRGKEPAVHPLANG
jgi:fatty acid desaturase